MSQMTRTTSPATSPNSKSSNSVVVSLRQSMTRRLQHAGNDNGDSRMAVVGVVTPSPRSHTPDGCGSHHVLSSNHHDTLDVGVRTGRSVETQDQRCVVYNLTRDVADGLHRRVGRVAEVQTDEKRAFLPTCC